MERKIHRKIWEETYGLIPKDDDGRSYEIHHVNGNHSDNRLQNLKCVTIKEHFKIHLDQKDWGAAAAVAKRMGVSVEFQKELNSLAGKQAKDLKLGWFDPELKEYFRQGSIKGGKAHRGMRWFNNEISSIKSFEPPDETWKLGRLVGKTKFGFEKGRKLGTFWNKDGVNKRSVLHPGDGWIPGRYLTLEQRNVRIEIARRPKRKKKIDE